MNVMERVLRQRIDPALTAEALSSLGSRAVGRSLRARSARVLTGGCWNRVIAVGFGPDEPELVLKISAEAVAPGISREFAVLRYFSEHTDMPVPTPYLLDASCSVIPGTLLVMQKLPGMVLHEAFATLAPRERERVADEIAEHVVALHRITSRGFGGVELDDSSRLPSWPEFWLPRFRNVLEEARREAHLSRSFLDRVQRVSARFDELLDVGARSTLTHYDIWSGNVMVDRRQGNVVVSGFIDVPGNWADPARELSFMEMFGLADERLHRRYGAEHDMDGGFELRKRVYNLKMHMKHVSMYPGEAFYREGAESCLRAIERAG